MKAWITGMTYAGPGTTVRLDVEATSEEIKDYVAHIERNLHSPPPPVEILLAEEAERRRAEERAQGYRDGVEAAARWLEADGMLREGGIRAIRALGAKGGSPCPECLGLGWDNACDDLGTVKCPKCHGGGRV